MGIFMHSSDGIPTVDGRNLEKRIQSHRHDGD